MTNDIDSPDYNDSNLGHMFDTPEEKEIERLEKKISHLDKNFKSQTVMWENSLKQLSAAMALLQDIYNDGDNLISGDHQLKAKALLNSYNQV